MIAITICSTRSYAYALIAQARKIVAAMNQSQMAEGGIVILVGDESDEIKQAKEFYESVLPRQVKDFVDHRIRGWSVELITGKYEDGQENYKNPAQLTIAQMRSVAFDRARRENVDFCWSLDSDVLPPPNSLRCMLQMLEFDDGFYSVSTCPYPSQGGGDYLGGRGTPEFPILPDFYDEERDIPHRLRRRMKDHGARLSQFKGGQPDAKWIKEHSEISDLVKKCPPIGNVFACNAKNFRRRGWMSSAYPGIGLGAVVPSDWCGFGCTLMNRRALSLAQFDGYDGSGTEDLYVVWKRWHPAGLKINVIPHCPCDHVIRNLDGKKNRSRKFVLCRAYHEYRDPECVGHLRIERRPWYQQTEGETFNAENNGSITHSPK
jgi:hypothetical protein